VRRVAISRTHAKIYRQLFNVAMIVYEYTYTASITATISAVIRRFHW